MADRFSFNEVVRPYTNNNSKIGNIFIDDEVITMNYFKLIGTHFRFGSKQSNTSISLYSIHTPVYAQ